MEYKDLIEKTLFLESLETTLTFSPLLSSQTFLQPWKKSLNIIYLPIIQVFREIKIQWLFSLKSFQTSVIQASFWGC